MDAIAKLSIKTVGVEKGEKQLKIFLLAVVRRGGHQQEMARPRPEPFGQPKTARLLQLVAKKMGGEFVRLVEHDQIPTCGAEFFLEFLITRHLIQANDEGVDVFKRIAARGSHFHVSGKDVELQPELFEHFLAPLIDQTARRDDDDAPGIGPQNEFADVKTRHDRLTRAGVVGEDKSQRLAWQHGFIHGGDLMREWIHI